MNELAQITASAVDEAAIRAASRKVASLEEELAVQRARIRGEVRNCLTPEQRAEADRLHADAARMVETRVQHGLGLLNSWIEKNAAK